MKSLNSIFKTGAEYWVAGVLLLVHVLCISLPGREASLASSNLMTNMIRLEALPNAPEQTLVLAGSSITGRLLPEYFSDKNHPVINVGLDGCGSLNAMESVLQQKPRPKVMLIEVNTLSPGFEESMEVVNESISHWRIAAQGALPFLKSKERPVELLYDFIHTKARTSLQSSAVPLQWSDSVQKPPLVAIPEDPKRDASAFLADAKTKIAAFRAAGTKVGLIFIPNSFLKTGRDDFPVSVAQKLATELDIPLFDLRQCPNVDALSWTDGVHLTRHAAREIVRFIEADVLPRIK